MNVKLIVTLPPSVNHCYFYLHGKRIKTATAKAWENITYQNVKQQMIKQNIVGFDDNANAKVICNMYYYFPDRRKRDTHNTFKLLFDTLEDTGLYKNDMNVLPRVIDWTIDRDNPRLELEFFYKE